jgi:ABC-type methionine transport system ATPase subunit
LAICRAVYHNPDIFLFDDAFSSLDIHVSQKIFTNLIENVLLPRGKTVIFATSSHSFVKPNSRVIIVTDSHNVVSSKDEVDRYLKKMEESGDGLTEITDSIIIEEKKMKNIDILPIDLKKKISSSEVIINISIQITK